MRRPLLKEDGHLDLVPLIDCVFLVLLFFMLCGNLALGERTEQITVPPARTGGRIAAADHLLINLHGRERPLARFGAYGPWLDLSHPEGLAGLRRVLDGVWDRSAKLPPRDGVTPSAVILEIRADGDVPMRAVQEVQRQASGQKPFIHLDFATRRSG
jgi:biopolymer transport protein ExbD